MKSSFRAALFFLIISTSITSCKSVQQSTIRRKADLRNARNQTTGCFVQMKDGTIKNYSTLKLVKGIFKAPFLIGDGLNKISGGNIQAYQTNNYYAISQSCFVSGHKTYVGKETLPGFAVRIAKGKINVYARKYYNGIGTADEYFIQRGDNGQILANTTENMNVMIKDDDEALTFFVDKCYTTSKTRKAPGQVNFR